MADRSSYADVERLVDDLSERGFPVEHTRIVGDGLHTVEYVTGRITPARAAGAGAVAGAWFGLLCGLLVGVFTIGVTWLAVMGLGLLVGAAWGALLGYLVQRVTRGSRDFSSVREVRADRYTLFADAPYADEARRQIGLT